MTAGITEGLRRWVGACALAGALLLAWAGPAGANGRIFGFNDDVVDGMHGVVPEQYAGIVRAAGGNAIRTNLDWRLAEPRQDVWNEGWWSRWEAVYEISLDRGVRPIFIIGFAPPWARAGVGGCTGFLCEVISGPARNVEMPPAPAMDVEWAEYAAEVALRFPAALIEVWNEPNTDDYWRPAPDPGRYAGLLTLAYHAIKAVSPDTEVVSGGILNVRRTDPLRGEVSVRDFLSVAYGANPSIAGSSDYIGLHPYPVGASVGPASRFAQAFRDALAMRDAAGDDPPILITETGVSTADLGLAPERRQADALERIHRRIGAMDDVAGVIYHRIVEPRDSSTNPREHGFAWLRYGGSPLEPRPVYCRFVAAAGRSYPGC